MKFSDVIKTVGTALGMQGEGYSNNTSQPRPPKRSPADVDRIFHGGYPLLAYNTPQVDLGMSPALGNLYYPGMYSMVGQRGYGLKLGGGGGGHHQQSGSGSGYGGQSPTTSYGGAAAGAGLGYGAPAPGGGYGGGYGGDNGGHGGGGQGYGGQMPRKSKGSSSVMTALTLLSFFFFINLLQSCLKEHMDAMNPTVMVMTAGVSRNRFSKLTDKYSSGTRELKLAHKETEEDSDESVFSYPNITIGDGRIKTKLNNKFYREDEGVFRRVHIS